MEYKLTYLVEKCPQAVLHLGNKTTLFFMPFSAALKTAPPKWTDGAAATSLSPALPLPAPASSVPARCLWGCVLAPAGSMGSWSEVGFGPASSPKRENEMKTRSWVCYKPSILSPAQQRGHTREGGRRCQAAPSQEGRASPRVPPTPGPSLGVI